MMNFKKDLEFGNFYELELLKYIDYDKYIQSEGNFKPYDLKIYKNEKITRYEVKADRITHYTNNITIEYECYNKPSGITTTKAKYYGYFVVKPNKTYDLYIIPVKKIKKYIEQKTYSKELSGGQNNLSKFYLFHKNKFEKYKINF